MDKEHKILYLPIEKKWFDMISRGEKTEDYRALKPHYGKLLGASWNKGVKTNCKPPYKDFKIVEFRNGYGRKVPSFQIECLGIEIGTGKTEWGAPIGEVFIIKLGVILCQQNTK